VCRGELLDSVADEFGCDLVVDEEPVGDLEVVRLVASGDERLEEGVIPVDLGANYIPCLLV
jgi:hypothetical protein